MPNRLLIPLLAALLAGCQPSEGSARDGGLADLAPGGDGGLYRSVEELYEKGLSRTCSLNGGVCHNSKEYPDLHSLPSLFATALAPCALGALSPQQVPDECEPEGDHLRSDALGIDREIAHVDLSPPDAAVDDLTQASLSLVQPATAAASADDWVLVRGGLRFVVGPATVSDDGSAVVVDLAAADPALRAFLDARAFPWTPSRVKVADTNGNGVRGHALGWSLLRPGDPQRSYLVARLTLPRLGELMPRQCRTWDERATRALYCWIKGLRLDAAGGLENPQEAIKYDGCSLPLAAVERCGGSAADGGTDAGLPAVQALFDRSCAFNGCHAGAAPAAGLDLAAGASRAGLVGIPSSEVAGGVRVRPGDAAGSVLWCKVDPGCPTRTGPPMPLGAAGLDAADRALLRRWIDSGARP